MLQVDRIILREIRLPLREPFQISSGTVSERRICVLELHHSDGPSEWAECVAEAQPNYSPETIDTAWLLIREWNKAREALAAGYRKIKIKIKPGRVGGLAVSRAIHDLCETHGLPVWCGGMLESGIGRAYNVALASLPNFTLPGDLSPSARYWERDIVTPEWTMDEEGMVRVPRDQPGIGVDVDRDRVDDLTVRTETVGAH